MEEVQPFGTSDIDSGTQLVLSKRFGRAKIGCTCAPMRQGDLDLQRQSCNVAHKQEYKRVLSIGNGLPQEEVEEQVTVAEDGENLGRSDPGGRATFDRSS
jgi:hypothetical protein